MRSSSSALLAVLLSCSPDVFSSFSAVPALRARVSTPSIQAVATTSYESLTAEQLRNAPNPPATPQHDVRSLETTRTPRRARC